MPKAAHLVAITLLEQAAAEEGAQYPAAYFGLHPENSGRSQPGRLMKHHPRRLVRGAGSLDDPVDDAAVEVEVRVQRRAEVVDEDHRAQPGRGAAAGTVLTQTARDGAQQDAHDHALQAPHRRDVICRVLLGV